MAVQLTTSVHFDGASRPASGFQYSRVTGLSRSVIAIHHSQARSETHRLFFRQSVDALMVRDRDQVDRLTITVAPRQIRFFQRVRVFALGKPVFALTQLCQLFVVVAA